TGWKGFRLLVHDAPQLFVKVPREYVTGSMEQVQQVVKPILKKVFGMSYLPPQIDYSVWGSSKGVRTNLFWHPATEIWPNLISIDDLLTPYGLGSPNQQIQHHI